MVFACRFIAVAGILGSIFASSAAAQPLTIELKKLGKLNELSIPSSTSVVQFYGISRGSISEYGDAFVSLPYGAKVSVKIKTLKGSTPLALESATGWRPLSLKTYQGKSRKTLDIANPRVANQSLASLPPTPPILRASGPNPSCNKLIEQGWALLITEYVSFPGGPSKEAFCALVLEQIGDLRNPNADGSITFDDGTLLEPGGGTSNPNSRNPDSPYLDTPDFSAADYGSAAAKFLVQKDTCTMKRNSKTIIMAEVDLTGVDRTTYGESFNIKVKISANGYNGNMAASIKPISDGKYAPQPLLLMSSLGGFNPQGQWVDVVRWSKKGPKTLKRLEVKDYAFWRGLSLIRVPIGSVLNGGRATFEYTNGSRAYSVCFKLTRTRQKRNGYY
jgi:hypothetical protein